MAEERSEQKIGEIVAGVLAPGAMVGRYKILSTLGQGGFGITYRAQDAELKREVAIKEYLPIALALREGHETVVPRSIRTADEFNEGRDRFIEEGRTLALLENASAIVRVFDFLYANGTAYIIMAFVRGDTLESRLRDRGRLPPEDVERLLWPLLDGLEQVHGAGFLHRDIKPGNILLDSVGNPTLIDFGAARVAVSGDTAAMTAIFTPGYAATEQFTAAKQGPWTDIYGLSATLFHALVGYPPPSAFDRILDDTHIPLDAQRIPNLKSGLVAGINAGLRVRPTERPQSIADWRSLLAHAPAAAVTVVLARPAEQTSGTRPSSELVSPSSTRRKFSLVLSAVVAVPAIAGGGYYILSGIQSGISPENARLRAEAFTRSPTEVNAIQPHAGLTAEIAGKWSGSVEDWPYNNKTGREMTISNRPDGTLSCLFYATGDLPGAAQTCAYKDSLLTIITGANNIVGLSPSTVNVLKGTLTVQATGTSHPLTMTRVAP